MNIRNEDKIELWNAINHYVRKCGGDPASVLHMTISRMNAVIDVEKCVHALILKGKMEDVDK